MKFSTTILAALAASAFAFSPVALHAQDQGAPPPPMDQGAPPPPDQQGAPPPDGQGAPPPDGQGAPPPDQGSDQGASFDEFYNNLSNDGQWIQTQDYGYVFQPAVQDPNWAPYTDGHWVYTAYGWTWASDEPWGWATYHYGRWANIDGTGWVWVPGYQWAPAWVSWRYGGGYCGWAPLPPSSFVGAEFGGPGVDLSFGFHFGGDCDTAYGIGPGWYNFIAIGFIGDPGYRGHYYDRSRNFVIINNTRNITNINVSRGGRGVFGGVNVGGPNFAEVNRVSHTPVQQVRLAQAGQAGRSTLSGGTLNVFAPRINAATVHQGRPATVARTLSNVQINRGTSISHPLQVNSQFKPAAPSQSAISAAREAQAHAPKGVATSTRVAPTVSAATVQQERTQSVQRQQAAALHNTAATPTRTTTTSGGGGTQEHQFTGAPNSGNTDNGQAEHNTQVQHEQELRQQQTQQQQQEREAATQQQQREETQRQQQATQQQHEAAQQQQQREEVVRQQQSQQQVQQQRQVEEQHSPSQVQHETAPFTQQRSTPVPQEQHQSVVPQQQHASQGGGGGGNSGGNHSSSGTGGGGNHGNGQNNNNGQGH